MKKIVSSAQAPAPIGPYSQAVLAGNMLFLSGQIALDPKSGQLVNKDVAEETHQVMGNILALLQAEGLGFEQVVKTSIFLKNMDDFQSVNAIYGDYFTGNYPARETIEVARLPKDVRVEISVIALKP